jgi:hypothetical protein
MVNLFRRSQGKDGASERYRKMILDAHVTGLLSTSASAPGSGSQTQ